MQYTREPNNCGGIILIGRTSTYGNYIIFSIRDDIGNDNTTFIFENNVYNITWYDADQQKFIKNKNVHISKVTANMIYGNYIQDSCPEECLCAHRDDLYNYITAKTVAIPLSNISEIIDTQSQIDKTKEVTKVSILGISTEFIRSVIVRLRIYNDDLDTEVTPIDMKVGNIYNVQYMDHKDHTMYEVEGKLIKIAIDRHFGDEPPQTGFVRPECSNPEQIGVGGMVYYNQDHFMELPKDCPEKVVFIFDTSKYSDSTFDHVRLTDIRDVYEVKVDDSDTTIEEPDKEKPCCETCPYINSRPPIHHEVFYPAPPMPHRNNHIKDTEINDMVIARCIMDRDFNGYIFFDKDNNELGRATFEEIVKEYSKDKY